MYLGVSPVTPLSARRTCLPRKIDILQIAKIRLNGMC
jgi:hypothetical protein